jgi:hypothetical protein
VERLVLEALAAGLSGFAELFRELFRRERFLGFGDTQFLGDLRRLAQARVPLAIERGDATVSPAATSYELTGPGRASLEGRADMLALNGIDRWLGGVHLRDGASIWRRDPATGALAHGLQ